MPTTTDLAALCAIRLIDLGEEKSHPDEPFGAVDSQDIGEDWESVRRITSAGAYAGYARLADVWSNGQRFYRLTDRGILATLAGDERSVRVARHVVRGLELAYRKTDPGGRRHIARERLPFAHDVVNAVGDATAATRLARLAGWVDSGTVPPASLCLAHGCCQGLEVRCRSEWD